MDKELKRLMGVVGDEDKGKGNDEKFEEKLFAYCEICKISTSSCKGRFKKCGRFDHRKTKD